MNVNYYQARIGLHTVFAEDNRNVTYIGDMVSYRVCVGNISTIDV